MMICLCVFCADDGYSQICREMIGKAIGNAGKYTFGRLYLE